VFLTADSDEFQFRKTSALALPPQPVLRRRMQRHEPRLAELCQPDCQHARVQVDIVTFEAHRFGYAHAHHRDQPEQRVGGPLTCAALRGYADRRDARLGSRCGSTFFVAERGGRLLHQYVHRVFWRLSREIGLRRHGDHTGPRVHDFRHNSGNRIIPATDRQQLYLGENRGVAGT
jgi:hypothetical protein